MQPLQTTALCAASLLTLGTTLSAQIPPHHALVGTVTTSGFPAPQTGRTGLFAVPLPTTANPGVQTPIPITGLPASMRANAGGFGGVGAPWLTSDGSRIVAGNYGSSVISIEIMDLVGFAVQPSSTSIPVGTLRRGWGNGIGAIEELPDGRLLVNLGGSFSYVPGSGPGAVANFAFLDLTTSPPSLTPLPMSGTMQGFPAPIAVSKDGRTAYVFTQPGSSVPPWRLYEYDIDENSPTFGVTRLLYTFPAGAIHHPHMMENGHIFSSLTDVTTVTTSRLDIDTNVRPVVVQTTPMTPANATLMGSFPDLAAGIEVHGSLAVQGSAFGNDMLISSVGGDLRLLASEPAPGWGFPYATALRPALRAFGEGTGDWSFDLAPNAGGLPELGNAGFGLQVSSTTTPPAAGWMLFGAARTAQTLAGIDVLVRPDVTAAMTTTADSAALSLPLPNDASLLGVSVFAQAVILEGTGLASSEGLEIGLIR